MTDQIARCAVLRGIGAVGLGAGALALFPTMAAAAPLAEVMVLPETTGIRHDSTPAGIATIRQHGTNASRRPAQFQAVVWRSSTPGERQAESYVDVEEQVWEWSGSLVGAYFASRPARQQATLFVEDRTTIPPPTNPSGAVSVLMRLDESPASGGNPITWWHDIGAGQAWYSDDHADRSCSDTLYTRMPLGGIRVVARAIPECPEDQDIAVCPNQLTLLTTK